MLGPSDTLFIEMAVAKGYLNRATADEALNIQSATRDDGADRRLLRDVVVEESWMTKDQVSEVDAQIEDGAEKTGRIEGYKLLAKVGQGGMGAVYKAEQTATGEIVALKILPGRMAQRKDFVERFLREARAAAKMKSEHIVRPVDVGFSGGYYYFAMEFVQGESVDTTLSIDGLMAESKALKIVHQMAQALYDADKGGMVHRDIKPGNILVTESGVAKLTDFGLAREIDDNSVTQAGVTLGTPNYMSPEQAKAMKSLDARSDIYSLGVTFYHMVTGAVPFRGETSLLTMLKHLNEQPVAPINRRPDLSPGVNDIILKMLAKDRDERYRTPQELVEDIELVMDGKPPKHAESTAPRPDEGAESREAGVPEEIERFAQEVHKRGRLKWIRVGAVLFLLVLAAIAGYALWPMGSGRGGAGAPASTGDDTGRRDRELGARRRLDAAKRFAADHSTEFARIADEFAAVEAACRATSLYEEARRLRAEARRKLRAAVEAAFQKCEQAATDRVKQDRFGDAVAAFDTFPEALKIKGMIERIDLAKGNLKKAAWDRFHEFRAQAEVYVRNRKLEAARRTVEPATKFGISGVAAEARELLLRIDHEAAAMDSERYRQAVAAYQAAAARVRRSVRRGQFVRALDELEAERKRATHALVRTMLDESRPTIKAARTVWTLVLRGLEQVEPGFKVRIGRSVRTFVSYDPDKKRLLLRSAGRRPTRMSPNWLPPATLKVLAAKGAGGNIKAVQLAAFFLAWGHYPSAAVELKRAKVERAAPALIKQYEKQLAMLQKSREEIEAENLLTKAREQAGSPGSHQQTARTLWELITKYANTRCYEQGRAEIKAMLAKAQAESITVDTLFAVRPTDLPGGVSELKYDFADPAQAGDWFTLWKNRSFGRWPIRPVYGEMTCDSGLVFFKVPLTGNYQVEIKARDVRSASVRFGMPAPSASPLTAGYSLNWKRTPGGATSTLKKAEKAVGQPRKDPRWTGGPLVLSVEVKNGTLTARAGARMVHRASVTPRPEGKDRPGYLVLDQFNPGARITSVVIRCVLDKPWLEKQFVEPLRKEKLEEARWRMARFKPLLEGNDAGAWRLYAPGGAAAARWTFAKGYAIAPERGTAVMSTGDLNWRDYAFATKVRIGTAPGAVRLMARWSDAGAGAGQGYYVELTAGRGTTGAGGQVTLGRVGDRRTATLKRASIDITGFNWYAVYVELRGERIRVLLGGREVLRAEDKTYSAGRVGLASYRCGAQFRDIKIKVMK